MCVCGVWCVCVCVCMYLITFRGILYCHAVYLVPSHTSYKVKLICSPKYIYN